MRTLKTKANLITAIREGRIRFCLDGEFYMTVEGGEFAGIHVVTSQLDRLTGGKNKVARIGGVSGQQARLVELV